MINSKILIGIMSGTSLDGIDIALTRIDKKKISVLDFLHINYSAELKVKILKLHFPEKNELEKSSMLSNDLAILTGRGINRLLINNNLSEFFAESKASSLQGNQLTGLVACCLRYKLFSFTNLFSMTWDNVKFELIIKTRKKSLMLLILI